MTRPTKLTAPRRKAIVALVRAGHSMASAASYTGINISTLNEWFRRGEGTDGARRPAKVYAAFAAEITEAREYLEGMLLASIVTAAVGHTDKDGDFDVEPDWRAAMKLLEKLYPRKYGGAPMRTEEEMLAAARRVAAEHGTDVPPEAIVRRAMEIAAAAEEGEVG